MSICPTTDEHRQRNNHVYSREFQSMLDGLDEEGCLEEAGHVAEKKRRLSVEQVKALEKNFEVENKLEPERKVKLAQELGLQPRQVAVWFQNRRARWKTKQLERDYGHLKANYDSLKLNYDALQHDNEALQKEIRELKEKLKEENMESNMSMSVKEEIILQESDENLSDQAVLITTSVGGAATETKELMLESFNSSNNGGGGGVVEVVASLFTDMKDGSTDSSDSSAILNEENNSPNNNPAITSSSSHSYLQFSKTTPSYQAQFVKLEEHNFFSSEEACNFFSDEQAPSLNWYMPEPDQWS